MDFLSIFSKERLRREIRNICDSYSNPWDILAELIQNSVDAIRLHMHRHGSEKQHKIEITINVPERSIIISDTGVGIPPSDLPELLAPHGTNKSGEVASLIGEKGVGLTYTIFSCNRYLIESRSTSGFVKGKIENCQSWKKGNYDTLPELHFEENDSTLFTPKETYTTIQVFDIEKIHSDSDDIFYISLDVLKLYLLTRTAIGSLRFLFETSFQEEFQLKLTHVDATHQKNIEIIPCKYFAPESVLQSKDRVVELEEFKRQAATMTDSEKAKKLKGKCLKKVGSEQRAGRKINYYVFFAPSRMFWEEVCKQNNLKTIIDGEDVLLYEGGIYFGTKGMPTGIRIEPPKTASPFYWANVYMVIEDDSIVFDIGRKAIPNRSLGLFREIAKGIFNDILKFVEYVRTDPPVQPVLPATASFQKHQQFDEFQKYQDLNLKTISFKKHPDGQEAGVVALFHELIGARIIQGYQVLKMGYKMTYDSWCMYKIPSGVKNIPSGCSAGSEIPVIIEFKYKAEDILKDFLNDIKYFSDIDLIVCWDLDEGRLGKEGVDVEPIDSERSPFHGANFLLTWRGSYNLGTAGQKHIIALRHLINKVLML